MELLPLPALACTRRQLWHETAGGGGSGGAAAPHPVDAADVGARRRGARDHRRHHVRRGQAGAERMHRLQQSPHCGMGGSRSSQARPAFVRCANTAALHFRPADRSTRLSCTAASCPARAPTACAHDLLLPLHYTACVRLPELGGRWAMFDDDSVGEVGDWGSGVPRVRGGAVQPSVR